MHVSGMKIRMIVIGCGTALLIAAAVEVALRERHPVSLPDVPVAQTPTVVRLKAVERNVETLDFSNAEAAKLLNGKQKRLSTVFGTLLPETV